MEGDGIAGIGKGFFTSKGQLKTNQQLQSDAAASNSSSQSSDAAEVSSEFSDKSIKEVIGAAKKEFVQEANQVISLANQQRDVIGGARELVKEQLGLAQDLKQAIKSGDSESADEIRSKLTELNQKVDETTEAVDQFNTETSASRVKAINVGNKQLTISQLNEVEFKSVKSGDLNSVDDVNNFISSLKDERSSLRGQIQDVRETKKDLRTIVKGTRQELNKLENKLIGNFEQATQETARLSRDIVRAGSQALLSNNIDQAVADRLLAG